MVDVLDMLCPARYKWFNIGLVLKVDHRTLKSIETEQFNRQNDCLREMLACRIQSGDPLTWSELSESLRRPSVEEKELADRIKVIKCK